jgi:hypothetical protein
MKSHERGELNGVVTTTNDTYPWSSVTQISSNGKQVTKATVKRPKSKWWLQLKPGTIGSVVSSLAVTFYEGNPDRSRKIWNIGSTERDILHIQVLPHKNEHFNMENWNHLFCRNVSYFTDPHCQFRSIDQGMNHTYLYLWCHSCQAQWDTPRCDQQNHQSVNYLAWGHHFI